MLVIQVALGIVLAVLILSFLPEIIALGAVALVAGLMLLIAGVAAAYFWHKPDVLVAISIFGGGYAAIWSLARFIQSRRPHLDLTELQVHIFAVALWVGSFSVVMVSNSPYAYAVFAAIGVAGSYYFVRWDRRARASWTQKKAIDDSYGQRRML